MEIKKKNKTFLISIMVGREGGMKGGRGGRDIEREYTYWNMLPLPCAFVCVCVRVCL
jgi:hypothetical protein